MTTTTPVVGITPYREQARWGVWDELADVLHAAYARTLEAVGAAVVLLPPGPPATTVAASAGARPARPMPPIASATMPAFIRLSMIFSFFTVRPRDNRTFPLRSTGKDVLQMLRRRRSFMLRRRWGSGRMRLGPMPTAKNRPRVARGAGVST